MPASAHTALVVSIVASALGALVMCLLVARYGLSTSRGDDPERGLLVTRFGHAFAGVCFAATGILALVALVAPTREARPAPTTIVKVEPDRAAEARLQALAADMKAFTSRLEQAEARMSSMDGVSRRVGDEVASMRAHAQQLERMIAAIPRRVVVAEPPVKESKPTPVVKEPKAAPVVKEAPRATPPPAVVDAPPPAPAAPAGPPAPAMPEPVAGPRPPAPEPVVTPRPRAAEPVAARTPEPAASARVVPHSGRATIEAPARSADGGAAMAKPGEAQLTDKLREDWKTIRGGLSTAGDDFKAAVRDLGRKLWR